MSWIHGAALAILTALVAAFGIGYVSFAHGIEAPMTAELDVEGDAIVALTGGGSERLRTAARLLSEGRGRRLLISGVNPAITDEDVYALLEAPEDLVACCIDLGRQAEDTLGNASETAAWARRSGFSRVIVVTDDYHMPRSLVELRVAMPDVTLIPYPVRTPQSEPGAWQRDLRIASRIGSEYVKYIVIRGREALLGGDADTIERAPAA
jgi:uncharacterized SAM-binding protein YcdF (DUF218 family)